MTFWDGTRWVREGQDRPPRNRVGRHILGAVAEGAVITALIFGLIAGSTFAAKGGGGGKPSGGSTTTFSGPLLVVDPDADGVVAYDDSVTFNVATSATSYPEVGVRCWQGNSWVYDGYVSYFGSWLSPSSFTLNSSNWNSTLAASCSARLFYYNKRGLEQVLGTIGFNVAP